jgi:HK97 family phage portal protein
MLFFGRKNTKKIEELEAKLNKIEASTSVSFGHGETWDSIFNLAGSDASVTPERAMRHSAVYASVRIIAGSISTFPLKTYERTPSNARAESSAHPAADLLRYGPNERMTASTYWRQSVSQMLLRGNSVAWIERRVSGQPIALWPVPLHRVQIELQGRRLIYTLDFDDGSRRRVDQDDILHIPGSMEWDGVRSKTPIAAYSAAVGIGLEADRYAHNFFKNDATPPTYITYPGVFKNGAKTGEEVREYYHKKFNGQNQHSGPAVLEQGGEIKQLDIAAEDAQILDTRRFQIEDIARIFGVPPHMIGAVDKTTSWGTGIEQQSIAFVQYTLAMHLKAIEQECNRKLFRDSPFFCEFDPNALLRGDVKGRYDSYRLALGGSSGPGFLSANEIRKFENLPPLDGGDQLVGWTAPPQGVDPNA